MSVDKNAHLRILEDDWSTHDKMPEPISRGSVGQPLKGAETLGGLTPKQGTGLSVVYIGDSCFLVLMLC